MGTTRKVKVVWMPLAAMAGPVGTASAETVSAKAFNRNFTTMAYLKSVSAKGAGGIGPSSRIVLRLAS